MLFKACNGCKDRHISCHSSYDLYKADRAKLDARNAKEKRAKQASSNITNYDYNKVIYWSKK